MVTILKIKVPTSRLLLNFIGLAHSVEEPVGPVEASKKYLETTATVDETHEYTNHTGKYNSTV